MTTKRGSSKWLKNPPFIFLLPNNSLFYRPYRPWSFSVIPSRVSAPLFFSAQRSSTSPATRTASNFFTLVSFAGLVFSGHAFAEAGGAGAWLIWCRFYRFLPIFFGKFLPNPLQNSFCSRLNSRFLIIFIFFFFFCLMYKLDNCSVAAKVGKLNNGTVLFI